MCIFVACWFRCHEESALAAERIHVGELVKSLGVEYHIVSLNWGERMEGGGGNLSLREKTQLRMLQYCHKMDIRALMVPHHLDYQIGE